MLSAVNVPQSKTVSIAFMSLKLMIFGIIISQTLKGQSQSSETQCTSSILSLSGLLIIFYALGFIVGLFALAYFFCKSQFNKIEYYVFYIFNIIVGLVCIIGGIAGLGSYSGCDGSKPFLLGVIFSAIIFQVNAVIAMAANLYLILKYLHFGSNLTWTIMWFTQISTCNSSISGIIGVIHGLLSIINVIMFALQKIYGKTTSLSNSWKLLTIGSAIMMILCYLLVMIGLVSGEHCGDAKFVERVYQRYGICEIVSPILVLIFLRAEAGDPRQRKIKSHKQVFTKLQEHEFIDITSKI